MQVILEEERALTARALRGMQQIAGLNIYGIKDPDSPGFASKLGVIAFDIKGSMPKQVAEALALRKGIGVRYGCHCAHIIVKHILKISPFIEQLQRLIQILFPKFKFLGVVRVSLGIENSAEEVDALIHVLGKIARQPRTGTDSAFAAARNGTPSLPRTDIQQQMDNFARAAAQRVYT